jgi:hypothetical protein
MLIESLLCLKGWHLFPHLLLRTCSVGATYQPRVRFKAARFVLLTGTLSLTYS